MKQTIEQSKAEVSENVKILRRAEREDVVMELRANMKNGFRGLVGWNVPAGLNGFYFEQIEGGLAQTVATQRFNQAKRELNLAEVAL
tara:strand:+ start:404 stop:664 length:261 start_codon:yes stop_codon:yes gene_type:complete